jgi:8-oxo-dGTP pyrophosphatase MutT (NUDIX family)
MKKHTRSSVMCIPVMDSKVVIVRDRKHREWTFPGGGKKHNETRLDACIRELDEETHSTLHVKKNDIRFLFVHKYSTDTFIDNVYVFVAFVSNLVPFSAVHSQFTSSNVYRACNKETDGIRLIELDALRRYNTWCKIRPIARRLESHPTLISVS